MDKYCSIRNIEKVVLIYLLVSGKYPLIFCFLMSFECFLVMLSYLRYLKDYAYISISTRLNFCVAP